MNDPDHWRQLKRAWLAVEEDAGAWEWLEASLQAEVMQLRTVPEFDFLESSALQLTADWLRSESDRPDIPPVQLGPWRLGKEIGRGGMATVYLAERADGAFDKQVAIKILNLGFVGEEIRRLFLRERQILARLDHPYIVRLLDGGVAPDTRPYLVTDFVDGLTLTAYVKQHDLPPAQRIQLFRKICEAVAYAHQHGVVHRDLKPANVYVTQAGVPKLLDFGIAKLRSGDGQSNDRTQTRAPFLTWAYASPEQARGEPAGEASDIYSLGVILCELLSGKLPYEIHGLPSYQAVRVICEDRPELPNLLTHVAASMLEKVASRRPATVEAVLSAMDASPRQPARRWLIRAGLSGVAAIGAGALWYRRLRVIVPPAVFIASGPDHQYAPTISPDGRNVAFTQAKSVDTPELVIRNLDSRATRSLVRGLNPINKAWSPDGRRIAFLDESEGRFDFYTIFTDGSGLRLHRQFVGAWIAWMPDSQSLLVCHREGDEPFSVYHYTLASDELRRVSFPRARTWGDIQVAASPEGKSFVVGRYRDLGKGDLYLVPMDGSDETRRLTRFDDWTVGMAFTPDGREVVAAVRGGTMRVPLDGGPMRPVKHTDECVSPSLSLTRPPSLVMTKRTWHIETRVRRMAGGAPSTVLQGANLAVLSPDGRSLAYVNDPGGQSDIWLMSSQGGGARPVTNARLRGCDDPRWSPDGTRVAFRARYEAHDVVYVADIQSAASWRVTQDAFDELRPSWSHDSKEVYFYGTRSGTPTVYRADVGGGSRPAELIRGAFEVLAAPDGQTLYFLTARDGPLMERRLSQAPQRVAGIPNVRAGTWGIAREGIYFANFGAPGGSAVTPIFLYRFRDRKVVPLAAPSAHRAAMSLTISVDAGLTTLAYTESKPDEDILLIPELPLD